MIRVTGSAFAVTIHRMPNGKPHDHPYTDIVLHGQRVYSERADALVREIHALGGGDEVADMLWHDFNALYHAQKPADIARLEQRLTEIRDRLTKK